MQAVVGDRCKHQILSEAQPPGLCQSEHRLNAKRVQALLWAHTELQGFIQNRLCSQGLSCPSSRSALGGMYASPSASCKIM